MKNIHFVLILVPTFIIVFLISFFIMKNNLDNEENNNVEVENNNIVESYNMKEIVILINDKELNVKLDNNSSSDAFYNKLLEGEIEVDLEDYGNFEKVGNLAFSLPTNDEKITTKPGDLILYQGDKITFYYDTNTYSFTKLGEISDIDQKTLKEILGSGNVRVTFKIK